MAYVRTHTTQITMHNSLIVLEGVLVTDLVYDQHINLKLSHVNLYLQSNLTKCTTTPYGRGIKGITTTTVTIAYMTP